MDKNKVPRRLLPALTLHLQALLQLLLRSIL
jgi:hypothetical protein